MSDVLVKSELINKILHLTLNNQTIAEIKSFKTPLHDVEITMRALFLLLGSDLEDLLTWQNIRTEMNHTGRDSLKRRISTFDANKVPKQTIERVAMLILSVDGMHIRQKSEGAAVFYRWVLQHVDNSFEILKEKGIREARKAPVPSYTLWKGQQGVDQVNGNESDSSEDSYHVEGHFAELHALTDETNLHKLL